MPGTSPLLNILSNKRLWVTGAAMLLLASCSSSRDDKIYVERPAEEFYNLGLSYLGEGQYEQAARNFDEVERQHPYSVWAPRAQLMTAYTYYQADSYDEAINTLDRFIQL
ncbi:MAG TPA: outer membrane protein assembly factor BamD, partial [Kiloniellales bacterium]|nr:outer membrane protein assembly factor BamD [Kiloniellales bacterium]